VPVTTLGTGIRDRDVNQSDDNKNVNCIHILTCLAMACHALVMSFTEPGHRCPQKRTAGQRRIVLVDIENVVGGSASVHDNIEWARATVERLVSVDPGDHVVIGCGPGGLLDLGCTWTHVRYVMRSGLDGADLALLDVLGENIAARFTEVVLVSGDGIFADAVAVFGAQGLHTTVIAHRDGLSRRLELAANTVKFLPDCPAPQPDPAVTQKDAA